MEWRLSQKVYGRSKIYDFFMANAPVDLVIHYSSIDKDFPHAISALRTIPDRDARIATFRRHVAEVAVGSNEFSSLKSAMGDDPELFDALDPCGPYIGLYLAEFRQEYHKMCESALKLYRNSGNTKRSLEFLNLAESALSRIADPTEAERRQRVGIGLQKRYWRLQVDRRLVALNMLDNKAHRQAMVLQLLNLGEFEFACAIIANYEMDVQLIGSKVDTLLIDDVEGAPKNTVAFIKKFQASQVVMENSGAFAEILYGVVMAAVYKMRKLQWVPVIAAALDDRFTDFRVKVLVQFGFVEEAIGIAERTCPGLVPLVGNLAQYTVKTVVVERAMKFLDAAKK
jgi:hypothetical protein